MIETKFILQALCLLALAAGGNCNPFPAYNIACERNIVQLQTADGWKEAACRFTTDSPRPLFSWTVQHSERGAEQTAYKVVVYSDEGGSIALKTLWDSGRVESSSSLVRYGGPPLRSLQQHYFTVQWWDQDGTAAPISSPGCFYTSFIHSEWISPDADPMWITAKNVTGAPYLRKEVVLLNTVEEAHISIIGLGYYRLFISGRELNSTGDAVIALRPGWTEYDKRLQYNTFDVSDILQGQSNFVIGVMLGLGWRNQKDYPNKDHLGQGEDERVLYSQMTVKDTSGGTSTVVSDESWLVHPSPIVSDTIYNGETYNASMEIPNWSTPEYKPIGWAKADIAKGPQGIGHNFEMPEITLWDKEEPVKIYALGESQIVDFGTNAAGVCVLHVKGLKQGTVVSMHHAEVPLHPPYGPENGSLYYDNLHSAKATDIYIAGSTTEEFYKPSFTYHGFRYVEVKGYPTTLQPGDITRVRINTDLPLNGHFNSSSPLLNAIQSAVVSGQQSNLMSVPTDCPQRDERLGWMGDAGLSSDSMAMNFDTHAFHQNFLFMMFDELDGNYSLPDVVPFVRGGSRPADPSWSAAFPQIVWALWKYYNDTQTAEILLPLIQHYLTFMVSKIPSSFENYFGYYGDWCPPPPVKKVEISFTSAFSLLLNINQTAELCRVVGALPDYDKYVKLFDELAEKFNHAFLQGDKYADSSQVSYALPLYLGIVPSNVLPLVVKGFANRVQSDGVHVSSGIIGAKFVLPALTAHGYHSLAVQMVEQKDYPSWGYMLLNPYEPATSMWELWNSFNGSASMDSRNHHMFSSVSGWLRTELIGLVPTQGVSMWKSVELWPARIPDLLHASTSFDVPHKLEFSWRQYPNRACFKLIEKPPQGNVLLGPGTSYTISCPSENSVIEEVVFASFGNPEGACGHFRVGQCHVKESEKMLRDLCVGRSACTVPMEQMFWGRECGHLPTRWLHAEVQCSKTVPSYSVDVNASIPMGGFAKLHLPCHGGNSVSVFDSGKLVWQDGRIVDEAYGMLFEGWDRKSDSIIIGLQSGRYEVTTTATEPQHTLCSYHVNSTADLICPRGTVVRKITFASYGSPETVTGAKCPFQYRVGSCHAGTSQRVLEDVCMGEERCTVELSKRVFGEFRCKEVAKKNYSLAVVYACGRVFE